MRSPAGFSVKKAEYEAMEAAILTYLRKVKKPVSFRELFQGVSKLVPPDLFPDEDRARWYAKVVQRDLEMTGRIERLPEPPVRLLVRA
ncbi:MAG TPA: hypothetical protein VEY12_09905 [Thermoplasmata archaeon]|nr:hypothetical protein [Thermoplasmata archaeon]